MTITVEKRELYFGTREAGSASPTEQGAFAGVPSPSFLDSGAARIPFATVPVENTVHETALVLTAPSKAHSRGPITAIAVAADSPIANLRLMIDGRPWSISPDRPYVGQLSDTAKVEVLPGRATPLVYRVPGYVPTYTQVQRDWVTWDMPSPGKISAGTFLFGADVATPFPCAKLEVYRGGFPPHLGGGTRRAVYNAEMDWQLVTTAGALNNPVLFAIVDGRRRFTVTSRMLATAAGGVQARICVWGVEGYKSTNGVDPAMADKRCDSPSFDLLLAATDLPDTNTRDSLVYQYNGNPYWGVIVQVLASGISETANGNGAGAQGAKGSLALSAWDD